MFIPCFVNKEALVIGILTAEIGASPMAMPLKDLTHDKSFIAPYPLDAYMV